MQPSSFRQSAQSGSRATAASPDSKSRGLGLRRGISRSPDVAGPVKYIKSSVLIGYKDLVSSLGGDAYSIISSCGLGASLLDNGSENIPLRSFAKLLELSASILGCPDVGMRLAAAQVGKVNIAAPLEGLIRNAPNLAGMFHNLAANLHIFASGQKITRIDDVEGMVAQRFDITDDDLPLTPQLMEYYLLSSHLGAVYLTGGVARTRKVWFSHLQRGPLLNYRERFGALTEFGQEYDAVFYSAGDLDLPIIGSDERALKREADILTSHFPSTPEDIKDRVRLILRFFLPQGVITRQEVASLLGINPRTLRRKLQGAGSSFELLRDEVRRAMALRYLARSNLPLTDIAYKLGYSESSVLSRSCRRWFNSSPSSLRRDLHW